MAPLSINTDTIDFEIVNEDLRRRVKNFEVTSFLSLQSSARSKENEWDIGDDSPVVRVTKSCLLNQFFEYFNEMLYSGKSLESDECVANLRVAYNKLNYSDRFTFLDITKSIE